MEALVYTAPLTLEMRTQPEPVAGPGEVLVDVVAAGICGSELEGFRSQSPFRVPPLVMGHEFAGRRRDSGALVTVNPLVTCGECPRCQAGQSNLCARRSLIGVHRPGAFAEVVAVPAAACRTLPPGVGAHHGALVEPFANAVHALRIVGAGGAQRIGVIGAGMLGLATALVARRDAAADVTVADLSAERRAAASDAGLAAVTELTGEFDLVVDAVGTAGTRAASVALLRMGGATVWIGLHGPDPGFDALGLIRSEQRVLGTFAYTDEDFSAALDVVVDLPIPWLVERPLHDGVGAFTELLDGPGTATKTVLVPG